MDKQLVISFRTVLYVLFFIFGMYALYTLRPIILIILVALVIVITIEHAVKFLQSIKIMNQDMSRTAAVILSYALLLFSVSTIFLVGLPPMILQAQKLFMNFSSIVSEVTQNTIFIDLGITEDHIFPNFGSIFENLFATTYSVLSSVAVVVSVIVLAIYMSLDWMSIKSTFVGLFSKEVRISIQKAIDEIEFGLGQWIKGQLLEMLIVGVIAFIGLTLIGMPYALALALIGALLEIIPIIGPLIATLLIGIVGFSESIAMGLLGIGFYILLQQFESNILIPKIMHRVTGFSPFIILLALMIGSTWAGAIGAIMAVPTTVMAVIVAKSIIKYSKEHQNINTGN